MKTVTLQIGNSDDKLSQQEWSGYVRSVAEALDDWRVQIHFAGSSPADTPWQNYAWVFIPKDPGEISDIRYSIKVVREAYRQESVAWTEGETQFV